MPGFPVLHHLLQLAQTHVHSVGDANQPSHPLSSPSPAFNLSSASRSFPMSQLFVSGGQNTGASASAISPSNEYSGLISFRIDWFDLLESKGLSRVFPTTTVQSIKFCGTQSSLWSNSSHPFMTTGKP